MNPQAKPSDAAGATIFDAFPRIVVINLPERTDRRADMLAELAGAGIVADDARVRFFAAIRPADAGGFPGIGARGCFMSHLGVIRDAIAADLDAVLILEDDLALTPGAALPQPDLLARLAGGDWDFAYAGHIENLPGDARRARWDETRAPLVCAHFYALSRRVLPALRDYLEACLERPPGDPLGGPMHVDGAFSMFRAQRPAIVTLICAPSLGGQRGSRSDIYPNQWYDRMPGVRALATLARRLRNRLRPR